MSWARVVVRYSRATNRASLPLHSQCCFCFHNSAVSYFIRLNFLALDVRTPTSKQFASTMPNVELKDCNETYICLHQALPGHHL